MKLKCALINLSIRDIARLIGMGLFRIKYRKFQRYIQYLNQVIKKLPIKDS